MDGMTESFSVDIDFFKPSTTHEAVELAAIAVSQLYGRARQEWPNRELSFRKEWNGDVFTLTVLPYPMVIAAA